MAARASSPNVGSTVIKEAATWLRIRTGSLSVESGDTQAAGTGFCPPLIASRIPGGQGLDPDFISVEGITDRPNRHRANV